VLFAGNRNHTFERIGFTQPAFFLLGHSAAATLELDTRGTKRRPQIGEARRLAAVNLKVA
jgi:hypothetical protein